MDATRFDHLAKALSTTGARRTLLHLLAALPLAGLLAGLLGLAESEAGRRKRRKTRHKHRQNKRRGRRQRHKRKGKNKNSKGKGKNKHKNTPCQPIDPCTGAACGTVRDNCGNEVDCGPCPCDPPCDACQTCGADGVCSVACGGSGCCADGNCLLGTADDTCGFGGRVCVACESPQTCGGGGITGVCGCAPDDPCTGDVCGVVQDTCGNAIDCGACPPMIQFFDAVPSTIDPGQSSTLLWEVTGADSCSISPTVGLVPCDGTAEVTPETTTDYELAAEVAGELVEFAIATVEVR